MMFFVNLYSCGKSYGGPEEGGWYYVYGDFMKQLGCFGTDTDASAFAKTVREKIEEGETFEVAITNNHMGFGTHDGADPDGNCDDAYLIKGGRWGSETLKVKVENCLGQDFPKEPQHYE